MRKIKYKAWDKHLNKMWEVTELVFENGELKLIRGKIDGISCGCIKTFVPVRFQKIILLQFTGLYDKKGKEIYEGDILSGMENFSVTYCNGMDDCLGMNVGWYLQRNDWESWTELYHEDFWEVIGNIYDNPKLL